MTTATMYTYEKIYFSLWEIAQRYGTFAQFRVIGKSHDDRMIPMLEIGDGQTCIFCLAGLDGTDTLMPAYLIQIAEEYCQAYECSWIIDEYLNVKKLLDHIRICFIPLLNPDGYEICMNGYTSIRNPIFRQMLRMQNHPHHEFTYNARGTDLKRNFPTNYYIRRQINQEPASENETKAFIRILQEYESSGLLSFGLSGKKIVFCRQERGFAYNQRSYKMARHLQKRSNYHLEKGHSPEEYELSGRQKSTGSPEQFYAEVIKQPSLMIETPATFSTISEPEQHKKEFEEICLLPLEYIHSLSGN